MNVSLPQPERAEIWLPKPVEFWDLLTEAYEFYREHFTTFFAIALIGYIPVTIGQAMWHYFQVVMPRGNPYAGAILGAGGMGAMLLGMVLVALGAGALFRAATLICERQEATVWDSYLFILRKIVPFMITYALSALLMMLGYCACCIGVIFTYVFFMAFVGIIFCAEGIAYITCLTRNFELVRARWLGAIGISLLPWLIATVISYGLLAPSQVVQIIHTILQTGAGETAQLPLWFHAVVILAFLWQLVAQALIYPYSLLCRTLFYYDVRIRDEHWDLEMLARQLERQVQERGGMQV